MLFLHSWAWFNTQKRAGLPEGYSGRAFTIMAKPNPRFGQVGDGYCNALIPRGEAKEIMEELVKLRRHDLDDPELLARYRRLLEERWQSEIHRLRPGALVAGGGLVRDGDVLACACRAEEALAGRCHRAWAAPFLVRAGWQVRQDGKDIKVEAAQTSLFVPLEG